MNNHGELIDCRALATESLPLETGAGGDGSTIEERVTRGGVVRVRMAKRKSNNRSLRSLFVVSDALRLVVGHMGRAKLRASINRSKAGRRGGILIGLSLEPTGFGMYKPRRSIPGRGAPSPSSCLW